MLQRVFSYGKLRLPETMPNYRLDWMQITDPDVMTKSGSDRHPILRKGNDHGAVESAYLELSEEELASTDDCEVADYIRVLVPLSSGKYT